MSHKTKKWAAAFAALQILLYHCWIPVFGNNTVPGMAERFLIASTYPAVDMFFFISAFSLVSRPVDDYLRFIVNRVLKLFPLFIIAWFLGQFLWFIPSIMIMYLVLPPLAKICRKRPVLSFLLLTAGWAGITYLILGVIRPDQDIGIFLFRIPSMILGAYAVRFKKISRRQGIVAGLLLYVTGMLLIYRFGYINRLNVPFRGTFYLTGIPVAIGELLILNALVAERSSRLIDRFGSMTLELYFAQMVSGAFLVRTYFGLTGSRVLTDLFTMTTVILFAAVIRYVFDKINARGSRLRL